MKALENMPKSKPVKASGWVKEPFKNRLTSMMNDILSSHIGDLNSDKILLSTKFFKKMYKSLSAESIQQQ